MSSWRMPIVRWSGISDLARSHAKLQHMPHPDCFLSPGEIHIFQPISNYQLAKKYENSFHFTYIREVTA